MGFFCNTNSRYQRQKSNCSCKNNCNTQVQGSADCNCDCDCECSTVAGATTTTVPAVATSTTTCSVPIPVTTTCSIPITCSCACGNSCADTVVSGASTVAGTTTEEVSTPTVRALLNTVIDSCCTTDDVCRELEFRDRELFDPDDLEVGTIIDVELDGDISFREVSRDKDDCVCISSVRYNIPLCIKGPAGGCGSCCRRAVRRDITVIRTAQLCCAANSILTTYNSRALAVSAVVSEICGDRVTITLCILFRSCLQQTLVREYTWPATPVCTYTNCNDARNSLLDPCDTTCGCVAEFTCPSC